MLCLRLCQKLLLLIIACIFHKLYETFELRLLTLCLLQLYFQILGLHCELFDFRGKLDLLCEELVF